MLLSAVINRTSNINDNMKLSEVPRDDPSHLQELIIRLLVQTLNSNTFYRKLTETIPNCQKLLLLMVQHLKQLILVDQYSLQCYVSFSLAPMLSITHLVVSRWLTVNAVRRPEQQQHQQPLRRHDDL